MAELPDDVALLWGLREPPRRGPKAMLTVDEIVRAATAIADAEGLAAVSMAKVAAELGNSTMALYRHVRSKDELLMLMGEAAIDEPPDLSGMDWRTALGTWSFALLEQLATHSWFDELPLQGPPIGPKNLAWFDRALDGLAGTPLMEAEKVGIVLNLTTYIHGQLRLVRDMARGYQKDPEAFGPRYGALLAQLADPARFPALTRVVADGVFSSSDLYDHENEDFRFGVDMFLDGVETYITRRTPPS